MLADDAAASSEEPACRVDVPDGVQLALFRYGGRDASQVNTGALRLLARRRSLRGEPIER